MITEQGFKGKKIRRQSSNPPDDAVLLLSRSSLPKATLFSLLCSSSSSTVSFTVISSFHHHLSLPFLCSPSPFVRTPSQNSLLVHSAGSRWKKKRRRRRSCPLRPESAQKFDLIFLIFCGCSLKVPHLVSHICSETSGLI